MTNEQLLRLQSYAYRLRALSLEATTQAGSGHPTSALSAADMVAALFFSQMRYNPADPSDQTNDRFILSKGHACPVLYAAWEQVGVISYDDLMKLRTFDSVLEGHPTPRFAYSEAAREKKQKNHRRGSQPYNEDREPVHAGLFHWYSGAEELL